MFYWHSEEVSLLGVVTVVLNAAGVSGLALLPPDEMLDRWRRRYPGEAVLADPAAATDVFRQLDEYARGTRRVFELSLSLQGTAFQQSVWNALRQIPYGEMRTYRDIARTVGNPATVRAVGMANRQNPVCIVVPCHRVIGSNGKLVGYAYGLSVKERLLALEASRETTIGCSPIDQAIC